MILVTRAILLNRFDSYEFEIMRKEAVVFSFKVLSQHLRGATEDHREEPQSVPSASRACV
jgi:hypothetical protein